MDIFSLRKTEFKFWIDLRSTKKRFAFGFKLFFFV